MAKKMMAPNETIWWVPISGLTPAFDPDAPTAAALNNALTTNISCAIVTGYTLNATASDTDDSSSICDNANVASPTFYNYEANLVLFREGDAEDDSSVYAKVFELFRYPDAEGYLVRRVGYANDTAAAAGQVVSSFYVSSDVPQDTVTDGGPIQMTVPFLPQGKMSLNKTLL